MRTLQEENVELRKRFDAMHVHGEMMAAQLARWQKLYKVCVFDRAVQK